jgi:hypothetical protein
MGIGSQDVNNLAPIDQQLNITNFQGNVNISKTSRLGQRFKKLKEEVEKDIRYNDFIEDFRRYNTELDGISMPQKLKDGGFDTKEIERATYRKHLYSKKLEKNILYESAQLIDLELFAMINIKFETYVEPLIKTNTPLPEIKISVSENVIDPIFKMINQDGQDDTFLNYNVEDIYGMIFFLTGKCHLTWANYDNI